MWVKTTKWVTVDDLCRELWSGARDKWMDATEEQREEAFSRLEEYFDQACADDGEENAVEMVTVNDALWFDMDDIWDGDDEEEDGETCDECGKTELEFPWCDWGDGAGHKFCSRECAIKYHTDNLNADKDDMSKLYIDRYGIHAGRITCDGCHTVFKGNPFVDDECSEYCSKECAEANGATGVHEDIAECMWCHYHSYGDWWSDNDGNVFCSRECAIRYNLKAEETARGAEDERSEMKNVNTILIGRIGGEFKKLPDGSVENTIVHSTLNNGEETVTFVTVRFRGKLAELVPTHLSVGDLCCIEGRHGEETTDTRVVKQYIEAEHMTFLSSAKREETDND